MKFSLLISLACTALPSMAYKYYSGPAQNFPGPDKWISFEDMFNRNKAAMFATGDTADDVGRIWMASTSNVIFPSVYKTRPHERIFANGLGGL
jgi:hypothetical protein